MKTLTAVLSSVVLSLSSVYSIHAVHQQSKADQIKAIRAASWRLDLTFTSPFTGQVANQGFCSGTAVAPHVVLTAAHCDVTEFLTQNGIMDAKFKIAGHPYTIVKKDVSKDLMLLYVPDLVSPYIEVASKNPVRDQDVTVVGYPFGLTQFVTEGKFQDDVKLDDPMAQGPDASFIATQAPISPGNSGGGLFVKEGGKFKLAGVASMGGGDVALFVDLKAVKEFLGL